MELILIVIAAMGGGVFASIIGGTNAFIFTGLTGLLGSILNMAGGDNTLLASLAQGPLFGPHVAFNSGVVALALLKRMKGDTEVGRAINGTNTFLPLYTYREVLPMLAAGLTGGLGYLTNHLFYQKWALNLDTVALTIVVYNVATRLLIGKSGLIPKLDLGKNRYELANKSFLFNLIWGAGLAMVISHIAIITNNPLIGFYISAVSLVLLSLGKDIPGTHHISLVAGYAALKFGNIWMGVLFGIFATLLGEYFNATVNTEADTLIDMPSSVIAFLSLVIFAF